MDILCDESYAGTQIDCPTCTAKLKVPSPTSSTDACPGCHAALPNHAIICSKCGYDLKKGQPTRKVSGPAQRKRRSHSEESSGFTIQKLIYASLALGLLAALCTPVFANTPPEVSKFKMSIGAFVMTTGITMTIAAGILIWINAFRESIFWGLGFFVPFIGGIVSLMFVAKHWGQNGRLFLTNLGGTILAMIGMFLVGASLVQGLPASLSFGEIDGSEFLESSTPREAFTGFQTAVKQNDYSSAFKYLSPEFQNENLDMNVTIVKGAQMMRGDATMKKVADEGEAILKKHGLPVLSFEEEMKNQMMNAQSSMSEAEALAAKYASITDKGQLYQELANTLKTAGMMGEEDDLFASLASSQITEPSIIGNTARGEGKIMGDMKVAVHFNQTQGTWLISEIEFLDMGALMEQFNAQMNGTPQTSQTQPRAPEVEDSLLKFQRQKAMSGMPISQYDWGMRYLRGDGVEQDEEQARNWLKMAANQGESRAKMELDRLDQGSDFGAESAAIAAESLNTVLVAFSGSGAAAVGEPSQEELVSRLNDARIYAQGVILFWEAHRQRLPNRLDETLPHLRQANFSEPSGQIRFEMFRPGESEQLFPVIPKSKIIILRSDPWQREDEKWERIYGFADGHSELKVVADGKITAWEKAH